MTRWVPVAMAASRIGFRDLAATYTWRTWMFGWFARLVAQVVFFAAIGLVAGGADRVRYLAIGNAMVIACLEALVVITAVVRERELGTLALQVAAPVNVALTYLARGLYCLVMGVFSSTAVFLIVAAAFGIPLRVGTAVLVPLFMLVVGASAYAMGIAVGAVVCRVPAAQWLAVNLSYFLIMTCCGVNVPVEFWPPVMRHAAGFLPLTHGLAAFRALLDGGPAGLVLTGVALEALVAAGWLVAGLVLFRRAVTAGRWRGTIELSA